MQYIFMCDGVDLSGGELLLEKIAKQLILKQNKVRICCRWMSEEMQARFGKMQAEVKIIQHWRNNNEFFEGLPPKEEIWVFTLGWNEYIRFSRKCDRKLKTILYIVHPFTVFIRRDKKNIIRKIIKRLARNIILKNIQSGNIIFMDEDTSNQTLDHYSFSKDEISNMKIVRIAINVEDIEDSYLYDRSVNENFNILSIARADFPFKGYLLGLVDFFAQKCVNDSGITLTIISYGDDIDQLKKKINEQPQEVKSRIMLVGKTDYDSLKDYYKKAKLYVGMGTTVLDTAQYGIPTIPVKAYTYELFADQFFMDDFRQVATDVKSEKNNVENLFNKVRSYSREEYVFHSRQERNIAIQHYGAERTTKEIVQQFDKASFNNPDVNLKVLELLYALRRK